MTTSTPSDNRPPQWVAAIVVVMGLIAIGLILFLSIKSRGPADATIGVSLVLITMLAAFGSVVYTTGLIIEKLWFRRTPKPDAQQKSKRMPWWPIPVMIGLCLLPIAVSEWNKALRPNDDYGIGIPLYAGWIFIWPVFLALIPVYAIATIRSRIAVRNQRP